MAVFDDKTDTLHMDLGGLRSITALGAPFGPDRLLTWLGPDSVEAGAETKANAHTWSSGTEFYHDGVVREYAKKEVTSKPSASLSLGDWTIVLASEDEDMKLLYRGSETQPLSGYKVLICDLATKVVEQQAEIEELAGDPDIAVPAYTVDDSRATTEVAKIAVVSVIDPWTGQYGKLPYDSYVSLREELTAHFAALLGHYSRRTANLMAERDGLMMRVQDSQAAEWAAAQNSGYWHQRATFAENLLQPFADCYEAVKNIAGASESMGTITCELDDTRAAYTILAEMRKDGGPGGNYEQFTRDRRQAKILDWAKRTFEAPGHDPVDLEERAFRFLEEALELWQSAMHLALTEANNNEAFCYSGEHGFYKPWMLESHSKLHRLIERVMKGDPGEIGREYGGVMITAACLAQVTGHSLSAEETREWTRVSSVPRETFQQRHQVKRDAGI